MDVPEIARYGAAFLGARLLGRKTPLVVSIVVTRRCNLACPYCDRGDGRGGQLDTADLLRLLDEMAAAGTRRIILTGGEPLLRSDLVTLLDRAHDHGFRVNLNTNGILLPRLAQRVLPRIHGLRISLDGDRDTHDRIRGSGAFDAAVEALRVARAFPEVETRLTTVISRENLHAIDAVLGLARDEGILVFFQPAELLCLGSEAADPVAPDVDAYRAVIDRLIRLRRSGGPVANSSSALRYLRGWPDAPALPCAGGRLFARLDSDGSVKICGRMGRFEESHPALELGFAEAFRRLHEARCTSCWCAGRVEVNQAFAMRSDAMAGLVESVVRRR
jgi:MoaA/NifB/PqqE/SkfB family radical SAM enzyme